MRTPSAELFQELKWLSFSDQCKYHCAVLIYKIMNNKAPSYLADIVTFSDNKTYQLRSVSNKDLVLQITPRTKYMATSFTNYSKNIWNDIPLNIRTSKTLKTFKGNYKHYLLCE